MKVDKSEETQEQHAAIPASAGRAFPSQLSPAGSLIEIPIFLQGWKPHGAKADAVPSGRPSTGLGQMQRVAPSFLAVGGEEILVEEVDLPLVSQWRWRVIRDKNGAPRKLAAWMRVDGKLKTVSLHRFLMKPKPEEWVDHANGNPLDNRRANLRICTPSQNAMNKRLRADSKSRVKGVREYEPGKFWARVQANGKRIYLGTFQSAEDAHRAYREAAGELHGEFARAA